MKKKLTVAFLLFSIYSNGQFQRLAILPTLSSVTITKAEAAQFASYCVDYFRKAPDYNTQYNNIISREQTLIKVIKTNGSISTMTMEEGLRGNRPILKMNATGFAYEGTFSEVTVSLNPQRTDIRSVKVSPIRKSKIITETPEDIINLTSDIVFKTYGDKIGQEELWEKSMFIEILKANSKLIVDNSGKLSSSNLNLVNKLEIEPSLKSIEGQTFHNLIEKGKIKIGADGLITEETKINLKDYQEVQDKILEYKLYSPDYEQGLEHLSLEQIISKVQKENNLEITGSPNPKLSEFLTNYGKPFEIVKDYELNGANENIIAANSSWYSGKYIIRVENKNYFFDKTAKPSLLNSKNILDLETSYMADVKSHSMTSENDISYIYFSSIDNTTKELKTQIGPTEKTTKLNDLNSLDEIIATIDNEIKNNSEKKNYVLSRDLFTKGKLGEHDKLHLSNLFGDKFIQGTTIGVEEKTWINYTELLRELKAKYPEKNFYLGGNFYTDEYAITNIPKIKSGSDIAAYITPKSLDLTFDQVNAMKSKLSSSGIMVHELDLDITNVPDNMLQANVLLLSGHKESAYEEFLKKLADKGLLRDKVVAVFSCNERGTANLNSYLIKKGYAKKVIFFPSKIDVTAINAVFSELSELTKNITIPEGVALDKLIDEAIGKAFNNPKYEDLKDEIKLFKEFINQTSFILFPNNQNQNG